MPNSCNDSGWKHGASSSVVYLLKSHNCLILCVFSKVQSRLSEKETGLYYEPSTCVHSIKSSTYHQVYLMVHLKIWLRLLQRLITASR